MINYLKTKFQNVKVKVTIAAEKGIMTQQEYKDKIEEAINQSEIEVEKEEII